jgi:hypothetical protein
LEYLTDISKGGWPSVKWLATLPGSASNSLKVTSPTLESLKVAKSRRRASSENQTVSGLPRISSARKKAGTNVTIFETVSPK